MVYMELENCSSLIISNTLPIHPSSSPQKFTIKSSFGKNQYLFSDCPEKSATSYLIFREAVECSMCFKAWTFAATLLKTDPVTCCVTLGS